LEFKNNELKGLNEALHNDLSKKALKLGYGGQKPMIAYAPQDYKMINRKLRKIKKLLNSKFMRKFMRVRKTEKAKGLLFEVKQSIALMPDDNDKRFLQDELKQFDEVLM
jgi:hypothetical protein